MKKTSKPKQKKKKQIKFNIAVFDPSMTAFGWVILNTKGKVIDLGAIKTEPKAKKLRIRKGDDNVRRVEEVSHQLLEQIIKYNVRFIASEQPHGSQNAQAALAMGEVIAIIQGFSTFLNIGIEWYSEGDCKLAVLGKATGTKAEMIAAIDKIYKVPWFGIKWKDEAVADALAVHYKTASTSSALKLFT